MELRYPTSKEKAGAQGRGGARVSKRGEGRETEGGSEGKEEKRRERRENGRGRKGAGREYSPHQS